MNVLRVLMFWALACAAQHCMAGAAPPRLWKAQTTGPSGRTTTVYVLGATHLGLPIEYDGYFERVVLPAFARADVLSYEGASGREPEPKPVCDPAVLTPDDRAFVARARETVEQVYVRAQESIHRAQLRAGIDDGTTVEQRRRAAHVFIAGLDEFDLREVFLLYGQVNLDFDTPADAAPSGRGAMVGELRRVRPDMPVRDVDSLYGAHRAYCAAGRERLQFLRSALAAKSSASADYRRRIPALEREFADLLARGGPAPGATLDGLRALDRTFLCGRNAEWMRDIRALDDGKVHFYVLGLKHLFPVDHDDAHCAGLLADLQAAGMAPHVVE